MIAIPNSHAIGGRKRDLTIRLDLFWRIED